MFTTVFLAGGAVAFSSGLAAIAFELTGREEASEAFMAACCLIGAATLVLGLVLIIVQPACI